MYRRIIKQNLYRRNLKYPIGVFRLFTWLKGLDDYQFKTHKSKGLKTFLTPFLAGWARGWSCGITCRLYL